MQCDVTKKKIQSLKITFSRCADYPNLLVYYHVTPKGQGSH